MKSLINVPTTGKVSVGLTTDWETKLCSNQASLVPLFTDYLLLSSGVPYRLPVDFHHLLGLSAMSSLGISSSPSFLSLTGMGKRRTAPSAQNTSTCPSVCLGRAKAVFSLFVV